ncbi:hypothetical protein FQO02_03045 [Salmonella enterica]|nr:hypothetical protein [Salmonella enterica]EDQ3384912.1 hypothetical protein [Salmonella enterica subsp. houtenae]EAQ7366800.1 hypothetical protein [Salmonella enterica]EAS6981347.1 hypothetical protein [Salmonella enterica]EAS8825796.1 hypothetical protein [Salmonella enterica]
MSSSDNQSDLSGRTDYQCAEIECGHRCVFVRFAHDD